MYGGKDNTYVKNGILLTRTTEDDPAYVLLVDEHVTTPDLSVYREDCYICIDPEYAQMGLSLCRPCKFCGGHVSADDSECDDCEEDQEE